MSLKGSKFDLNNKFDDFFEEESKKEYKYCTECKTKVLSDAKFCFNCGSKKFIDNLDNISEFKLKEIEEGYKNEYEKISLKINKSIKELEDLKNINKTNKKKNDELNLYWKDKIKQIKDEKNITSTKANSLSDSSNGYIKKIERVKEQIASLEKEYNSLSGSISKTSNKFVNSEGNVNDSILVPQTFDYIGHEIVINSGKSTKPINYAELENLTLNYEREYLTKYHAYISDIYKSSNLKLKAEKAENYYKSFQSHKQISDLEKAGLLGHTEAQFECGLSYRNERNKVKSDYAKANYWFYKAAKSGQGNAAYWIGRNALDGCGMNKDYNIAKYYLNVAFEKNIFEAMLYLAQCYLVEGYQENFAKAFNLLEKFVLESNSKLGFFATLLYNHEAYYYLGLCYENGYGCPINASKALDYYQKSNLFNAEKQQVFMYYNGNIIPKDVTKSFEHAKRSLISIYSNNKDPNGIITNHLGVMLYNGEGTTRSYKKAFEKFISASGEKMNNMLAQYNVGICYLYGRGVDKDLKMAKQFFEKSSKQGFKLATKALELL